MGKIQKSILPADADALLRLFISNPYPWKINSKGQLLDATDQIVGAAECPGISAYIAIAVNSAADRLIGNLLDRFKNETCLDHKTGCLIWMGAVNGWGHGRIRFNSRTITASRAMWILKKGPILHGLHVCHKCDNPPCVNIDHLFLGTHQENMADKKRKGRGGGVPGEDNHYAKLTTQQVLFIRASADSQNSLAVQFKVNPSVISEIIRRKTWKHI